MKLPRFLSIFKKSILLLLLYIILSSLLMNFSNTSSLTGIRWIVLQTVEFIHTIKSQFEYRHNLEEEYENLKRENFQLKRINQGLREKMLENIRLKKLLHLKETNTHNYISARVIGVGLEKGLRSLILDVGTQDSIRKNLPVANAEGLVGKVISTTPGQCVVQVLMDLNANVSAKLQNSREKGMIGWSGNSWLDLDYIPRNIKVQQGEVVVTSGVSQIYPPGIKIGVVTKISETTHEFHKKIRVKPSVNFNALEEVYIIQTDRFRTTNSE